MLLHHFNQLIAGISFCLATTSASAVIFEDWQLNGTSGTTLTGLTNTGTDGNAFITDITNMTTDGSGNLSFTGGGGVSNVDITNISGGTRYIVMEGVKFNLSGSALSGNDDLFGLGFRSFTSGSGFGSSGADVATMVVGSPASNGNLVVEGRTRDFGNIGATTLDAVSNTTSSFNFILAFDDDSDNYSILYNENGGAYTSIGSAASGATATYLTLWGASFNNGGESITIDRFYVTDVNPVPEPTTYAAILGVVMLGFGIYRKRRR